MAEIHQLFAPRTSYGPDRLKVLGTAFDEAWQSIANAIGETPAEVESARAALANVILSLPHSEIGDAASIRNAALQIMAARTPNKRRRA